MPAHSTRLYCHIARNAPIGAIFRRGPSNHVQLLKWHMVTDQLTPGQWFKGRIYERRCDLSPNGEYLIYFAANHKPPYGSWTAISRLPFFTALALWPKGDCWGGGGLFDADEKGVSLNHRASEMSMPGDFKLPPNFRVRPHGEHSGWGEDEPIMPHRLIRDGWQKIEDGQFKENKYGTQKVWFEFHEPQVWQKLAAEQAGHAIHLELHGIKEANGPWYVLKLTHILGGEYIDVGPCDWADITPEGVVHYSNGGELRKRQLDGSDTLIIDLAEHVFSEMQPSPEALVW